MTNDLSMMGHEVQWARAVIGLIFGDLDCCRAVHLLSN